jgi:hypothetical protein
MVIVMVACVFAAILTLAYANEANAAKARDRQVMHNVAPLAINFARAHFSALDTDGNGTIDPEELEAATKRTWPNEDQATVEAALGYLAAYEDLIGHRIGPSAGTAPAPLEGINREDLNSWPERMAAGFQY